MAPQCRTELLVVGLLLFGESSNEPLRSPATLASQKAAGRAKKTKKIRQADDCGVVRLLWLIPEGNVFHK